MYRTNKKFTSPSIIFLSALLLLASACRKKKTDQPPPPAPVSHRLASVVRTPLPPATFYADTTTYRYDAEGRCTSSAYMALGYTVVTSNVYQGSLVYQNIYNQTTGHLATKSIYYMRASLQPDSILITSLGTAGDTSAQYIIVFTYNAGGEPVSKESYIFKTRTLLSVDEYTWNNGNLVQSVYYDYPRGSYKVSTVNYTYNTGKENTTRTEQLSQYLQPDELSKNLAAAYTSVDEESGKPPVTETVQFTHTFDQHNRVIKRRSTQGEEKSYTYTEE